MLKTFVRLREAGYRLVRVARDQSGVVSFEYVIVAACIVGAVGIAFGNSAGGTIATTLSAAIGTIAANVNTAVGA